MANWNVWTQWFQRAFPRLIGMNDDIQLVRQSREYVNSFFFIRSSSSFTCISKLGTARQFLLAIFPAWEPRI